MMSMTCDGENLLLAVSLRRSIQYRGVLRLSERRRIGTGFPMPLSFLVLKKFLGLTEEDVICDGNDQATEEVDEPVGSHDDPVLLGESEKLIPSNSRRG